MHRFVTLVTLIVSMLVLLNSCASRGSKPSHVDYSSEKSNVIVATARGGTEDVMTCPADMILIPSGPTLYGPPEEKDVATGGKEERITVNGFCIDKFEYPNEANAAPMRSVTWLEARKACGDRGKRLCAEQEWEKACRGPAGTLYTYGDGFAAGACPNAADDYGLGQFSNCVSGFGVQDMSGGVFEWTNGTAGADQKMLRGGLSKDAPAETSRCTYRVRYSSTASGREVGFRCCANPTTKAGAAK